MNGFSHPRWGSCAVKTLVTKIGSGKTPTGGSETYVDDGVLFLRSQNIHFDGLHLTDVAHINDDVHREMWNTRLQADDVLLNITGASLGRVARFQSGIGEANVNQHVCILRPTPATDSRYLTYAISSRATQGQISQLQMGGNRDGLNFEQVGNLRVPAVPPEQQRRIADFLDVETARMDRLVLLRRGVSARLAERENAFRDNLIEFLEQSEGRIPLRRLATTIEQGSSPQCDSTPRRDESEWGVLKLSSVKRGVFLPNENKRLPEEETAATFKEVRHGDLLVTRANTPTLVGDAAVVSKPCSRLLLPDLIYRVNLTPGTDPNFIAQILLGNKARSVIESIARGSSQSMVKLRGEDIKSIPVPNASPSQQREFAIKVTANGASMMALRSGLARQIELLSERRQALITAAVTGQFDVSTASGRGVTE